MMPTPLQTITAIIGVAMGLLESFGYIDILPLLGG